jgi:hypothetical protein
MIHLERCGREMQVVGQESREWGMGILFHSPFPIFPDRNGNQNNFSAGGFTFFNRR